MVKQWVIFLSWVLVLGLVPRCPAQGDDLIGWWSFEEESGILKDRTTYQNDGTPNGGLLYRQSGICGFALEFNGTDSYVEVGKNGRPSDTFSFGAWIQTARAHKIDPEGASLSSVLDRDNKRFVFAPRFEYDNAGAGLSVGTNGMSVYESGKSYLQAPAVYRGDISSDWNHVMVVYDQKVPTLYLNGQAVYTGVESAMPMVFSPIHVGGEVYGFFDGQIDEVQIYNRALAATEVEQLVTGYIELAYAPNPVDRERDVYHKELVLTWSAGVNASQHDVYVGTVADDVNNATPSVDPAGTYRGRHSDTSYPLETLDFDGIYYWRVDEITPDKIVKGKLWQFEVEAFAIDLNVNQITATASSSKTVQEGPERTIDGSGLDGDLHGTQQDTMWRSLAGADPDGAWIQYELDRPYLLQQMLVWNYNSTTEKYLGYGVKDVTIDTLTTPDGWTQLGGNTVINRAPSEPNYAPNTVIDLGDTPLEGVRLNIASNWMSRPQYGLSEIRLTAIPMAARKERPLTGSEGADVNTMLRWRPGRQAAEHRVFLSANKQTVIDETAPMTTVMEPLYEATALDLGVTYYWKVNEVNAVEEPALWEGDVWSFTVAPYLTVEDFEDYNNYSPHQVFQTWTDGFGFVADDFFPEGHPGNETGSILGHDIWVEDSNYGDVMEMDSVHEGAQSAPLYYSNLETPFISEMTRTFVDDQDWTAYGIQELSLMIQGQSSNIADQLYLEIHDSAGRSVVFAHPDGTDAVLATSWTPWVVDLQEAANAGVDLALIRTLVLRIGDNTNPAHAEGMILVDSIRLYSSR